MNAAAGLINRVIIAIGSNMDEPMTNCRQGVAALAGTEDLEIAACSGFYITEPVGYARQPWFVNAAVKVRTRLDPLSLLRRLKQMESRFGRRPGGIRNGPRILDLDIIFYNDQVIETAELVIPHPRMQERGFVLRPLCEIAAEWKHPVFGKTACRLLEQMQGCHEKCIPMAEMFN
ncbi:MAG: 2-amino-4-hydroxy-6-hydroxymethyldihydropteridine diphosphokinase [Desulfosalsimonadaceae bacterium]